MSSPAGGFGAGPLAGRTVVATRSRAQASVLVERLAAQGATVVELPVIAIEDAADGGTALGKAADRLVSGAYEWVAFTSANAASRLLAALDGRTVPDGVRWAAVGSATARRLSEGGFPPDLVPLEAVSDSLADAFPECVRVGATVLFPRAETVRGALAAGLETKGWTVDEVVAYRTVAGDPDPTSIAAARDADAIAFTSSSTVERTVALLGVGGVPPVVVSIGPVTSATARVEGLEVRAEAIESSIDGLVAAVVAALNPESTSELTPDEPDLGPDPGPA
ncbi:MAG TPA: uroporphyrinogen-III synthase [Acidimicrobiales bacterium]|jgi:uroporphyrinogen III methyltransferase/synthase|nr:uroporphyrinogen-III synthase [Acidimicrobiales bacterium]